MGDDALNVPTVPVGQHKDQAVNSWEDPAGEQGDDDSARGDDGVVLQSGGDVEEPVQGQHGGGDDGDQNDPEPNTHLYLAFRLDVVEVWSSWLISEVDNNHHNYRQAKVSHGLVENEEKDGLTAHPGLRQPYLVTTHGIFTKQKNTKKITLSPLERFLSLSASRSLHAETPTGFLLCFPPCPFY